MTQAIFEYVLRDLTSSEGGFFFTAADAQQLPVRPKKYADREVPSGNSVAALVLSQLARLTAEPK